MKKTVKLCLVLSSFLLFGLIPGHAFSQTAKGSNGQSIQYKKGNPADWLKNQDAVIAAPHAVENLSKKITIKLIRVEMKN